MEIGLYYNRFRYYNPRTGSYISKDPIGLAGNNPNLYAYTYDTYTGIDSFGLFNPKILTDSSIFRGNKSGYPLFSLMARDISHYTKTGNMLGISTCDNIDAIKSINKNLN